MEAITGRARAIRSNAARTFANAFHDYPLFAWCLPAEEGRWAKVRVFYAMMVNHGILLGQVVVMSTECERPNA
jgi:hypothetical protein